MKIHNNGDILTISNIKELAAGNSEIFRDEVRAVFPSDVRAIEIDLSQTEFVDSSGLGALVSVYKLANPRGSAVAVRLVNPAPPIQQILELTRLHRLFEIVVPVQHD